MKTEQTTVRSYIIYERSNFTFKCVLFDSDGVEDGCGFFDTYDEALEFGEDWL